MKVFSTEDIMDTSCFERSTLKQVFYLQERLCAVCDIFMKNTNTTVEYMCQLCDTFMESYDKIQPNAQSGLLYFCN